MWERWKDHVGIGSGFLAIEFRAFNTRNATGAHVLRIARFDSTSGPRWTGQIVVDEFQPHTLACGAATILLEGAGNHGELISYVLNVDSSGVPTLASRRTTARWFGTSRLIPPGPVNIGNWARPGVIELPSRGGAIRFQIRMTDTVTRSGQSIVHAKRTVLEEIDAAGKVHRSLIISEGTVIETVDILLVPAFAALNSRLVPAENMSVR